MNLPPVTKPEALNLTHNGRAVKDVPLPKTLPPFLPADGEDMLMDIMVRQASFQASLGQNFPTMPQNEKIQFIKDMVIALTDELHEALGEVGWKPWATSRHINEEEFKGELIDALHFLMNLCLVVGMGPHEVWQKYVAKNERNFARQREGYDGVSGKCLYCKMALDEPGHQYEPGYVARGFCGSLCHAASTANAEMDRAR